MKSGWAFANNSKNASISIFNFVFEFYDRADGMFMSAISSTGTFLPR